MAEFIKTQYEYSKEQVVAAGALTGIIAGLVMILFSMFQAWLSNNGFFTPLNLIAALFFGTDVMVGNPLFGLTGLLIHLVLSTIFGIVFAIVTENVQSLGGELSLGLIYGVAIWSVMSFLVLPFTNPLMSSAVAEFPGWWLVSHLVFGAVLVLTPIMEESVAPEPRIARRRAAPMGAKP